ncbi:MAG: aminotransferase class V-fold PLP-dependent enzyme [Acidimicrobiales bacterium]
MAAGVMAPRLIYLDGNSLGPPAPGTADALHALVDEWERELIGGWNRRWWDLPVTVGERIAPLVGAAPGQVVVGDSTTVLWFKLASAALRLRPDRRRIVTQAGGFPTDRHVLDALDADVVAVAHDEIADALDDRTAVLAVTHVDYRTGRRLDLASLTATAHDVGAVAVWDLSHSVGAMDLHLDRDGVDLAVGCTYKYLNGGPGSPAFAYVAERHAAGLEQPIPGWVGHADPFSMSEVHIPASGIRRLLSGTPAVLGLVALDHALDRFDGVDPADLRARSLALSDRLIAGVEALGLEAVAPRAHEERGSQVGLRFAHAWELGQALIAEGVIGDVRPPDLVRLGVAPLYSTDADIEEALLRLALVLETQAWSRWVDTARATVT